MDASVTLTERKGDEILLGRAEVASLVEEAARVEEVGVRPHSGVVVHAADVGQHDGVGRHRVASHICLLDRHVGKSKRRCTQGISHRVQSP